MNQKERVEMKDCVKVVASNQSFLMDFNTFKIIIIYFH